jgi:hypothetical protein
MTPKRAPRSPSFQKAHPSNESTEPNASKSQSDAVDLSRVRAGEVPVLDSHQTTSLDHLLGKTVSAWVDESAGALMGRPAFAETAEGERAAGLAARGEATAISIGYRVHDWLIEDSGGNKIDQT